MKCPQITEGEWLPIIGVGVASRIATDPTEPKVNICVSLSNNERRGHPSIEEEAANVAMMAAAPRMASILEKILYAHQTKNNGAAMGEAVLCRYFEEGAKQALREAGYTDTENP